MLIAALILMSLIALVLLAWRNPDRRTGLETEWDDPVPAGLQRGDP